MSVTGPGSLDDITRERLRAQLVRHEGLRLKPYVDSVGKLTIGVGRNLTDVGISAAESGVLLDNDIDAAVRALVVGYSDWFVHLDPPRQAAMVNMMFNLGAPRFATFRGLAAAMQARDYRRARVEMLTSKWAVQVGLRATELADIILTDAWPRRP